MHAHILTCITDLLSAFIPVVSEASRPASNKSGQKTKTGTAKPGAHSFDELYITGRCSYIASVLYNSYYASVGGSVSARLSADVRMSSCRKQIAVNQDRLRRGVSVTGRLPGAEETVSL